jgi:uncharacterized protein YdaT
MWTPTHFPAAMRSLTPSTRAKAIELANDMLAKGDQDQHQVIVSSINEARSLARRSAAGELPIGYFTALRV